MYGNYTGYGMTPYQQQLAQNRLNQMEQQYNAGTSYQPNNYQMQNSQQMGSMQILKGRPVSSYDEAKASMIDLDGSLFVFPDIANKRIYTKQIMLDGSAELKVYALQDGIGSDMKHESVEEKEGYVLKRDFDKAVGDLKKQIKELKEGVKNVTAVNENDE